MRSIRRSGFRSLLVRAALVVVSSVLTLAVFEMALRFLPQERKRMLRYDPRTIYALVPHAARNFKHHAGNGGHVVRTTINSAGFRGEELEPAPEKRVVVYGDSFILGEFSALHATFVAQLEDQLNRRCPWQVETVNAGVVGYGPDQELRKLAGELPELRPDLVIVAVFSGNDFGDLMRNKLFYLSPEGELRENDLQLSAPLRKLLGAERGLAVVDLARKTYWHWLAWREKRRQGAPVDKPAPVVRRTHPRNYDPMDQWLRDSQREYAVYIEDGDRIVRQIHYDHNDADISLAPDSESARYKIRLMGQVLARLEGLLAAAQVDRLLLIIPPAVDVCENYDFEVDPSKFPQYEPAALTRAVERGAEECGLPFLSLWESFDANEPNTLYFHHGDSHWNDRGQAFAADTVAARIVEQYWSACQ